METSISLGNYEPDQVPEPWEEYRYRDLFRAYYTQSVSMAFKSGDINLVHCITALTSLELNKCFTDSAKNIDIDQVPRKCYLSALTIYMDNKGRIVKGEKVLTEFKLIYDHSENRHLLDTSYKIRKEKEACIHAKELHKDVLENKTLTFRSGKIYVLKKFHEYIKQASLCNRRTDVNYTNLKVAENRDELNKTLSLLGITTAAVGFIPGKALVIADTAMKILGMALSAEPRFSLAEYTYPIKGPVYLDQITKVENYERKSYNGYVNPSQTLIESNNYKRDVLAELEEFGLKIK